MVVVHNASHSTKDNIDYEKTPVDKRVFFCYTIVMLNFLKSNWFSLSITIILVIICIMLIQANYFIHSINLNSLIPSKTKLSINLNMSELNTTINQKAKLSKNEVLNGIIEDIGYDFKNYTDNYNLNWPDNILEYIEPEIIYYITDDSNEWGILAKAQNKKLLSKLQSSGDLTISMTFNETNIYKLTTKDKSNIYFTFISSNIISISSNHELVKQSLNNYINNTDSTWQERFSIINLEPILKIKIDPSVAINSENNSLLTQFYNILTPILDHSNNELSLEFNQTGNYLTWQISNIQAGDYKAIYNKNNMADSLSYINFKPDLLIGSYKPNLAINNSLQNSSVWEALTNFTLSKTNVNIPRDFINKTQKSILIAIKDQEHFLTIINEADFESTIQIVYEILGKQTPTSIKKILPDGSSSYELISDETSIQERSSFINNKEIITIFAPNADNTFNYYIDGKKIILSTDYQSLVENINNRGIVPNQCVSNNSFSELLYIDNTINNPYLNSKNLDEFTVFDQSFDENVVIKGCLKLK